MMKFMMKKVISLLLIAVMLLSFVACADTSDGKKDDTINTPSETTAPLNNNGDLDFVDDDLPDNLNFDGKTVNVLTYDGTGDIFFVRDFTVEELTSDVVNDSIYNRERYVEERLGVEIKEFLASDVDNEIRRQFTADEDTYQLYDTPVVSLSNIAISKQLVDLYTVNYLDLDKPWWSQKFNDEASICDSLYFTTGDLSLSLTRYLFAIYYNKEMAKDYVKETPELEDLYSIVESGDWTFDKFVELGSGIYTDNNGNNEHDEEDIYGINFVKTITIDAIWSSFDLDVFSKTDDGWFELSVNTDKLYNSLGKINTLLHETEGVLSLKTDSGTYDLDAMNVFFAGGTNLFMVNRLLSIENTVLRNMTDDYGVLPFPKYDKKQTEYYSFASDRYTAFAIPKSCGDYDIAAAVLEAMASYAYRETQPAYLDIALKGKYMSDPQSRKMLDLVVDGFKVDASWIYLSTLGCDYPHNYRYMVMDGNQSYASQHQSASNKVKLMLKAYRLEYDKNG